MPNMGGDPYLGFKYKAEGQAAAVVLAGAPTRACSQR